MKTNLIESTSKSVLFFLLISLGSVYAQDQVRTLENVQFRSDVVDCAESIYASDSFQKNYNHDPSHAYLHIGTWYQSTGDKPLQSFMIYSPFPNRVVCVFRRDNFNGAYFLRADKQQEDTHETLVNGNWKKEVVGNSWYIRDPYYQGSNGINIGNAFSNEKEDLQALVFSLHTQESSTTYINGFTGEKKLSDVELKNPDETANVLCVPALKAYLEQLSKEQSTEACEKVKKQLFK